MCIVCLEWQKGKLTTTEAWRNLSEIMDADAEHGEDMAHYWDVAEKLAEKLVEESDL